MKKNRYKFQNFQERLSHIKVDVTHRIEKRHELPEDEKDSFFNEGLLKWRELDCSENFVQFDRDIRPLVSSYAQVIYHKDAIVNLLAKHMAVEQSLAYQSLLELTVALAKDLQQEFLPCFEQIFLIMVNYLHQKDTDLMEHTFVALAYIFKHLWRHMIHDLENIFRIYKTLLLEEEKLHIVAFAAESFSFLLRKCRDPDACFHFIFKEVSNEPSLAEGVGHLFFNTVKGIKKKLHSCAEDMFTQMLPFLKIKKSILVQNDDPDILTEKVCVSLCTFLSCVCKHICESEIMIIWNVLEKAILSVTSSIKNKKSMECGHDATIEINHLLSLGKVMVSYRDGKFLSSIQSNVFEILFTIFKLPLDVFDIKSSLINLVIELCINCEDNNRNNDSLKNLVTLCFEKSMSYDNLKDLISGLVEWTMFESICLPPLLNFCQDSLLRSDSEQSIVCDVFTLLSVYVCSCVDDFDKPFEMDANICSLNMLKTSKKGSKTSFNVVIKTLIGFTGIDKGECTDEMWRLITCLPYMHPKQNLLANETLQNLFCQLKNIESPEKEQSYLLACVIKSMLLLFNSKDDVSSYLPYDEIIQVLRKNPDNAHILQAFDAYIVVTKNLNINNTTVENLSVIVELVKENISSPSHLHRWLALRIINHFDQHSYTVTVEEKDLEKTSCVVLYCLNAEETPADFNNYRNRLLWIEKVSFCDDGFKYLPSFYLEIALRYVTSNLFVNLRPMWESIKESIASFANRNETLFWKCWSGLLLHASAKADTSSSRRVKNNDKTAEDVSFFNMCLLKANERREDNRGDHVNFYKLLWETMSHIPSLIERKSRDVMDLFFKFLRVHYYHRDETIAPSQDIRLQSDTKKTFSNSNDNIRRWSKEENVQFLITAMKLFSLLKSPKSLYREAEYHHFLYEFLTHKNAELQKLSLACLLTYKYEFLLPYKDNFDRLLEDTSCRGELLLFSTDGENDIVKVEHRSGLWPIITRLLFGKMQRRSGLGVSGKSGISSRRNVLMQFMCNSSVTEMSTFVDLIVAPFKELISQNKADQSQSLDISSIVPLHKQTSFLNMLHHVFTRLGNLVTSYLSLFLDIILELLGLSQMCLTRRSEIDPSFLNRIKMVRQLGITRLNEYFELFQDFQYSPIIERLFKYAVSPQISQLYEQCQSSPTPLMKLLFTWSNVPRFIPLLGFVNNETTTESPLAQLINCLKCPIISSEVSSLVLTIIENLLVREDYDGSDSLSSTNIGDDKSLSIGSSLLQPHLNVVLMYLKDRIKLKSNQILASKRDPRKAATIQLDQELVILAKLSQYIRNPDHCQSIISILLPLTKKMKNPVTQANLLESIHQLMKHCENPSVFVPNLCCLFSDVTDAYPRRNLCHSFAVLASRCEDFKHFEEIILDLNAWNPKRLDEPDYDRRLKAFSNFDKLLTDISTSVECFLFVTHNCLKYLRHDDDMSLRDASSSCLSKVIKECCQRQGDYSKLVIQQAILPTVKHGLHSNNSVTRSEFISLLSLLVRSYANDTQLKSMLVLCADDPDADFFENIRHIQMHRRIRAVRRLFSLCQESPLPSNCMASYLLPIISHFIFDNLATKDHNLVTETITTIGGIAQHLNWSKYSHLLRSYLTLLPKDRRRQKSIVRVIVAILDAFHFDLTNVKVDVSKIKQGKWKKKDDHQSDNEEPEEIEEDEEEAIQSKGSNDSKADANYIHHVLTEKILPKLRKALTKKSSTDDNHKMSHNKEEDDQEVLRVPVVLAMVKLLQQVPKATFHMHLPGMLLRVCETLRSRARDVRDTARDTLVKICLSLGPEYLGVVLREMRGALKRGYQLHVLGFTVHAVLDAMITKHPDGNLDHVVDNLMEVLLNDIFGDVSEEKEVEAITGKLHEAKAMKSYDSLEITARLVSTSHLMNIIKPIKVLMETKQTYKESRRIETVLRRIAIGLHVNKNINEEDLLRFIHGILHVSPEGQIKDDNSIPNIMSLTGPAASVRQDVFLIPKRPDRGQQMPTTNTSTNDYLLTEFGLQLLQVNLKRQRFSATSTDHAQMLNPFVSIFVKSLKSNHNKIVMASLRCLSHVMKFPLTNLSSMMSEMAKSLFILLRTHARVGAGQGENLELVQTTFKTMTNVIRDFKNFKASEKQLKILLTYVEEDVSDYMRQATAFPLLKAILSRRFNTPAIYDIMNKICELSVSSDNASTRQQSRQLMVLFLLDYPLGKKMDKFIQFYISHLSFEMEYGRESTFEVLIMMFTSFPEALLSERAAMLFVPLAMSLTNDDSSNCRRMASVAIKVLLEKIENKSKVDYLFTMVLAWTKGEKITLRCLGLQLIGIFCDVEKETFEPRLSSIVPEILQILSDYKADNDDDSDDESENEAVDNIENNADKDHMVFNCLSCLAKQLQICDWIKHFSKDQITNVWEFAVDNLLHRHTWIRLACSQLIGSLVTPIEPSELIKKSAKPKKINKEMLYLSKDLSAKVTQLIRQSCDQLKSDVVADELCVQVVKNLVYLSKVVTLMDKSDISKSNKEDNISSDEETVFSQEELPGKRRRLLVPSVEWALDKMCRLATYEAAKQPKSTFKRMSVFKYIAALTVDLSDDERNTNLVRMLGPLHREVGLAASGGGGEDTPLQLFAREVLNLIKTTIGKDSFSMAYAQLQIKVSHLKENRKRKLAIDAVNNPQKAIIRKQHRNVAKRIQRKRKLIDVKPILAINKKPPRVIH